MRLLQLLPVGRPAPDLLQGLQAGLASAFAGPCDLLGAQLDPAPAFHGERGQYHSSELLRQVEALASPHYWRILGVAEVDLYIPILTFVFGEAQVNGRCAVISSYRLRQDFYGLAPDPIVLRERLLKEAVHELGHTVGLAHCSNYECAMAAAHSVEVVDLRRPEFCRACAAEANLRAR